MKAWKLAALNQANDEAIAIEDEGHTIERFNDYHWRVDGRIDVWPSSKKYMVRGVVREYEHLQDIFEHNI